MTIGDTLNLAVIGKAQQSLPSPTGSYTQTVMYEVYQETNAINGPELILMTRDLFEKFVGEVRKARDLGRLLQPIDSPGVVQFVTGANDEHEELR